MTEQTPASEPGHPDTLAELQVTTAHARDAQADRAAQEQADEAARRSIGFDHASGGRNWRVHVAPATARGNLQDEGFAGEPERGELKAWVERNRAMLGEAADRKIAAGAVRDGDVWVHTHDFRQE